MEENTSCYSAPSQSATALSQALDAVKSASADRPLILSLDRTLLLCDPTEAYLDTLYPRHLGAALLALLKVIKPWCWFPARYVPITKDGCLIVVATLLFPWTLLLWPARARKLALAYGNQPLMQAARHHDRSQVVVVSRSFGPIVKPIIKNLPIMAGCNSSTKNSSTKNSAIKTVARRFWPRSGDDAHSWLLASVKVAIGQAAVTRAVAVTSAPEDAALLKAVADPYLVAWPETRTAPAMSGVYVPLLYSEIVKNPKKSHFLKQVLLGHWAFLAIALSFLSPHPFINAFSLFLLTLSYWCVYEIGYQENDRVGERYERVPILSDNYKRYKSRLSLTNTLFPWLASGTFALLGVLLLEISKQPLPFQDTIVTGQSLLPSAFLPATLLDGAVWLVLLIATRFTFWLYNQLNEETRIWVYPILQLQKFFGFTLLMSTNTVGVLLLSAVLISRWMHYSIYRCGGDRWQFPINLSCLMLFLLTSGATLANGPASTSLLTVQFAVALTYCGLRALKGYKKLAPRWGLVKPTVKPPVEPATLKSPELKSPELKSPELKSPDKRSFGLDRSTKRAADAAVKRSKSEMSLAAGNTLPEVSQISAQKNDLEPLL